MEHLSDIQYYLKDNLKNNDTVHKADEDKQYFQCFMLAYNNKICQNQLN